MVYRRTLQLNLNMRRKTEICNDLAINRYQNQILAEKSKSTIS